MLELNVGTVAKRNGALGQNVFFSVHEFLKQRLILLSHIEAQTMSQEFERTPSGSMCYSKYIGRLGGDLILHSLVSSFNPENTYIDNVSINFPEEGDWLPLPKRIQYSH